MDEATATRTFQSVGLDGVQPDLDSAQAMAVAAAKAAGVQACDLLPALRASAAAGERPYLPFDGHLTPRGHEVVAGAIRSCLASPPAG